MARELRVSADVAKLLPASTLAQLQVTVDDSDNACYACEKLITGSSAEVVVFTDTDATLVKFAHSECMASGVRLLPGLREAFDARANAGEGFAMATLLGVRQREPKALIFLEPEVLVGGLGEDPLELYATALGLTPVSGPIEEIDPGTSEELMIERVAEGLVLRAAHGTETVPAAEEELHQWLEVAGGRAMVIVARGLGLARPEPTIEKALMLRPAWAAVATIEAGLS